MHKILLCNLWCTLLQALTELSNDLGAAAEDESELPLEDDDEADCPPHTGASQGASIIDSQETQTSTTNTHLMYDRRTSTPLPLLKCDVNTCNNSSQPLQQSSGSDGCVDDTAENKPRKVEKDKR